MSTVVTPIENVATFVTSDITDFTEKSILDHSFEMVSNTRTVRDWVSVSSTNGTVSFDIAFFTGIRARWANWYISVEGINWTMTGWGIDSVSRTGDTGGCGRTGGTLEFTRLTFLC
jgi:hypothetical protein